MIHFPLFDNLCRLKDDEEIFEEDGFDIEEKNQVATLKITGAEVEDSGKYSVEISNSAGCLRKDFTLIVQGGSLFAIKSIFGHEKVIVSQTFVIRKEKH